MDIRILNEQEILPALHLVWEVFAADTAPQYTPEGVGEFQNFIKYEQILPMVRGGGITFFGAFEEQEMTGVLALLSTGQIALFFVKKEWQGKGIGRMLFQAAYNYCARKLMVRRITVQAIPSAVEKYRHLGMQPEGGEVTENGMVFVPMELFVIAGLVQPVKRKKAPIIIAAVAGAVLLIALCAAGFVMIRNLVNFVQEREDDRGSYEVPYDDSDPFWDDGDGYDYEEPDDSGELSGIEGIEADIADDLSYELEEDSYAFSDQENTSVLIDFYVNYPVVTGLKDQKTQDTVNEAIQACAKQTVDEIYDNPSPEIRNRVLEAQTPALISYVEYKVCYADNDLISIVFDDSSYKGSEEYLDMSLRTININLQDGTVYQVKDIVDLSSDFLDEWLDRMRSEAENDDFLSELDVDGMRKALEGSDDSGVYTPNFFVYADGIEIGFDLNYPEGDSHDLGYIWVTAPFETEELDAYHTDSTFWQAIGD